MTELYWAIIPYLVLMLIVLGIVTYVPSLMLVSAEPEAADKTAAAAKPAAGGPQAPADAGVVRITWPDGGMWTPDHCEKPEIKGDTLSYADCQTMFKNYAKCDALTEELDRMECRDKVLAGEAP
jgi:hypothetical protein